LPQVCPLPQVYRSGWLSGISMHWGEKFVTVGTVTNNTSDGWHPRMDSSDGGEWLPSRISRLVV
jgi:hypothetical protein